MKPKTHHIFRPPAYDTDDGFSYSDKLYQYNAVVFRNINRAGFGPVGINLINCNQRIFKPRAYIL